MKVDQDDKSQRHHSRAIVVAALIGAVGYILAAVAGHWLGREQGSERQAALEKQLASSSRETADLRKVLDTQAQELAGLKERLEKEKSTPSSNELKEAKDKGQTEAQDQPQADQHTIPLGLESRQASQIKKPLASEREHGFTFDLLECRGEGSVIDCDLMMTNHMPDRWLSLHSDRGRTHVVDDLGGTCSAKSTTFNWGTLSREVPLRITVEFGNCPRDVKRLSYVELSFSLGNPAFGEAFKVPFRGVPVL